MAFVSLKAWRTRSAERAGLAARVKHAVTEALGLTDADAVALNEVACPDPGCPDLETIVLVMRIGEPTRALRVRATLEGIGPAEIAGLAAEERTLRAAEAGSPD